MLETPPLGLYIHVPWCIKKCPYCDFNSHAVFDEIPEKNYVQALLRDLEQDLPRVAKRRLYSVFFGGGTPSLFSPDAIHTLIDSVKARIVCSAELEVTLEANPGTVEKYKFRAFKEAGVNRLSIGIQSFQPAQLKALGRIHSASEAAHAAEEAHRAGIDNFNLDLMYGLPGQRRNQATDDILRAIALEPAHISYYQLTIEEHTLFAKFPPCLPGEDEIWEIQCENQAILSDHGYRQYEISAYARPGFQCRHNLNYWTFGDYLGIGAGAHAKITDAEMGTITRISKLRHPQQYMRTVGSKANIGSLNPISTEERALEYLMNALRLHSGFDKTEYSARTGLKLSDLEPELTDCLNENLLEQSKTHIRCSKTGRNFLDAILLRFVPRE
ncbi:MAG: radical SAM family heme chaperone HemW [Methylococcaceae bacterium]|nr:radical SAM family heme chaperone HemW [Methylococcaceae bacterium]